MQQDPKMVVQLPKIYEEPLIKRFNPDNAVWNQGGYYEISEHCGLCDQYRLPNYKCGDCPFDYFRMMPDEVGCMRWIGLLIDMLPKQFPIRTAAASVYWRKRQDKEAREFLLHVNEVARLHIDFRRICGYCAKMLDDNRKKFCDDCCKRKWEKAYPNRVKS